jgi:hypothetical protein
MKKLLFLFLPITLSTNLLAQLNYEDSFEKNNEFWEQKRIDFVTQSKNFRLDSIKELSGESSRVEVFSYDNNGFPTKAQFIRIQPWGFREIQAQADYHFSSKGDSCAFTPQAGYVTYRKVFNNAGKEILDVRFYGGAFSPVQVVSPRTINKYDNANNLIFQFKESMSQDFMPPSWTTAPLEKSYFSYNAQNEVISSNKFIPVDRFSKPVTFFKSECDTNIVLDANNNRLKWDRVTRKKDTDAFTTVSSYEQKFNSNNQIIEKLVKDLKGTNVNLTRWRYYPANNTQVTVYYLWEANKWKFSYSDSIFYNNKAKNVYRQYETGASLYKFDPIINRILEIGTYKKYYYTYLKVDTKDLEKLELDVEIFPNPASSTLQVQIEGNNIEYVPTVIKIYNTVGQLTKQFEVNISDITNLDIADLDSGLYFLNISSKQGQVTKKFVKM